MTVIIVGYETPRSTEKRRIGYAHVSTIQQSSDRQEIDLRSAECYPVNHVLPALRYQLKTSICMGGGGERAAGFRLVAIDTELFGPSTSAFAQQLSARD